MSVRDCQCRDIWISGELGPLYSRQGGPQQQTSNFGVRIACFALDLSGTVCAIASGESDSLAVPACHLRDTVLKNKKRFADFAVANWVGTFLRISARLSRKRWSNSVLGPTSPIMSNWVMQILFSTIDDVYFS